MARGGKRNFKGRGKSFTNPEALERDRLKQEKEKAWRRQRGEESESSEEDSDSEGDSSGNEASGSGSDDGITFSNDAAGGAAGTSKPKKSGGKKGTAAAKAESSSEEESDSDEEEDKKRKGAEGLIEVVNPNLAVKKNKKVSQLDPSEKQEKPQLSRREREEIEKQRAKARYQKLHAEGKTDEARADLARLAIIRKQREEAAAKREAEKIAKDNAAKSKQAEVSKAIGRRK